MIMRHRTTFAKTGAVVSCLLALGACRSTDADLGMTPAVGVGQATALTPPVMTGSVSPASAAVSVQFLPVVGAPPEKAVELSQALAGAASSAGVAILPASAPTAPLRLKGYLSAIEEGPDTLVVFVWDVVDPAGARVNRLQGQVRAAGTAGDPWSAVGPDAMKAVADQTMAALAAPPRANRG